MNDNNNSNVQTEPIVSQENVSNEVATETNESSEVQQTNNQPVNSQPVNSQQDLVGNQVQDNSQVEHPQYEIPNVLDNKCPNCAAPLFYNPELDKWKCNYCDSVFDLKELQKHKNASTAEFQETPSEIEYTETTEEVNYVTYNCQNCGAEIIADEQTSATFCVYCGNTAILKNKLSGKFAPDFVIPFQKSKDTATKAFKELSKGRPLMPKGFNDEKNIEKIRGIYIPFWLYDYNVSGTITYSATKVTTWRIGDTHYTKTDYYDIFRNASMDFDKIPADSSTRFADDIMDSIMPYNYSKLKTYNHAYLSGFLAEKYDDSEEKISTNVSERAKKSAETVIYNSLRNYSSKTVTSNNLIPVQNKRYYALMPVWMVNVKYGGKPYIFAMNGENGKFIGDIPVDKKKAIIIAVSIFVIIFLVIMLLSFIANKAGY